MSKVFLELLNISIMTGWVVLVVLLLRVLLKKAPAWVRCALWGIVGLRLVWPFHISSPVSLIPSRHTLPYGQLYDYTPELNTGIDVLDEVINPGFTQAFESEIANSVNPLQVWLELAGWVWLLGMVVMAVYAAVSFLRLRRRVAVSMPLEGQVYLCDRLDSPFILGLLRPRIYLPSGCEEAQKAHILAHENCHLARKDHWWKPLGFALLTVHWFNPLLWLAYILLCRDMELACDERVIRQMTPQEKKAYSEVLLRYSISKAGIGACPLAFGEVGVKQRIKAVLDYKKPVLWIVIAAIVVCAIAAVCLLTEPAEDYVIDVQYARCGENSLTPFDIGSRYRISKVIYDNSQDVYAYTTDNTLLYDFLSTYEFAVRSTTKDEYVSRGLIKRLSLQFDNFDQLFKSGSSWQPGFDAASLRQENMLAWRVSFQDGETVTEYFILQQEDLNLYLAVGTHEINTPVSATVMHCVFQMETWMWDYRDITYLQAYGDVDDDGLKEYCYMTAGPTSGIHSVRFVAKREGNVIYNTVIYSLAELRIDNAGNLRFVGLNEDGEECFLQVIVIDGKLCLYLNGEPYAMR